jgi:hypothetical protein
MASKDRPNDTSSKPKYRVVNPGDPGYEEALLRDSLCCQEAEDFERHLPSSVWLDEYDQSGFVDEESEKREEVRKPGDRDEKE